MFPIFSQKLVPTLAIVNCQNDVLNLCYNFRKTDRHKINSGEVQIGAGVRKGELFERSEVKVEINVKEN